MPRYISSSIRSWTGKFYVDFGWRKTHPREHQEIILESKQIVFLPRCFWIKWLRLKTSPQHSCSFKNSNQRKIKQPWNTGADVARQRGMPRRTRDEIEPKTKVEGLKWRL